MDKVNGAITNLLSAVTKGADSGIEKYLDPNAELDVNGVKKTKGIKSLLEFFSANPDTMKIAPSLDINLLQSENGDLLRRYVATLGNGETAEVEEAWRLGENGLLMLTKMIVLGKEGKREQTKRSVLYSV